jgi:NADP-dependent 3-hydroxy acid dehydrogenase YdfG
MTQIGGLFDLSGRVAIVTGATGVLGGAMARGLAAAGARVGVLGRREEPAKNVAVEIVDSGAEALALPADVHEREQLHAVREATLDRWGRVDI